MLHTCNNIMDTKKADFSVRFSAPQVGLEPTTP